MQKLTGVLVASAAAAMFSIVVLPGTAVAAGDVKCMGANACKGQSACKTADNACKGHNSCKGKGWVKAGSKEECEKMGGTVMEEKK